MTIPADPVLHITIDDDWVRCAGRAPGPLTSAVELPGGYMNFDVLSPGTPVEMVITDGPRPQPWATSLLGLDQAAWQTRGSLSAVPPPASAFAPFAAVAQVAWLSDWSPTTFPADLLDLDRLRTAARAALPDQDGRLADLADRRRDRLVALAAAHRARHLTPLAAAIVSDTVVAARLFLPTGPMADLDLESARPSASVPNLEARLSRLLRTIIARRAVASSDAMISDSVLGDEATGIGARFSVDRRLVPPGILLDGENTIGVEVSSDGTILVRVPAIRAWRGDADVPLLARLVDGQAGIAVGQWSLELDRTSGEFIGRGRPFRIPRTGDIVDVFLATSPWHSEVEIGRRANRRIRRVFARAFAAERLCAIAQAPFDAWRSAAAGWDTARQETRRIQPEWEPLALGHLAASRRRGGQEKIADALVEGRNVVAVDGRAWGNPTLAELSVLGLLETDAS